MQLHQQEILEGIQQQEYHQHEHDIHKGSDIEKNALRDLFSASKGHVYRISNLSGFQRSCKLESTLKCFPKMAGKDAELLPVFGYGPARDTKSAFG